jgi:hypothetical protein
VTVERAAIRPARQCWIGDIDLAHEQPIDLKHAARLPALKVNGRPRHVASLYRWCSPAGCRGVRLETVVIGGTTCTTSEAVGRFIARLSEPQQQVKPETLAQRQRRFSRAEAVCESAGI